MSNLNKFLLVSVCSVAISIPLVRDILKSQHYLATLNSGVVLEATQRIKGALF